MWQCYCSPNCTRHFNLFSNLDAVRPPHGAGTLCWALRGTVCEASTETIVGGVVIVNLFGVLCFDLYMIFGKAAVRGVHFFSF